MPSLTISFSPFSDVSLTAFYQGLVVRVVEELVTLDLCWIDRCRMDTRQGIEPFQARRCPSETDREPSLAAFCLQLSV